MPIVIACQHCDWKGKVKDELAGKKGKCPTCGELIPIPERAAPAAADEPDVVDDADVVDDRPPVGSKSGGSAARRRPADVEDEDRPRRRRPADVEDEDDRPSRARRRPSDDEEGDDRPSKPRRRGDDDDEDDRPSKARRRLADDEDEDRPRPKRRSFDDDDDEPPRRRKRKGGAARRESNGGGMSANKIGSIVGGIFMILLGLALFGLYLLIGGRFPFWAIICVVLGVLSLGRAFTQSDD